MAPLTDREIITSERALAVMTSHATLSPPRRVMIEWLWRGYLLSLRHAGAHLVTLIARYLLMLRMIEADPKRRRNFRRARVTA